MVRALALAAAFVVGVQADFGRDTLCVGDQAHTLNWQASSDKLQDASDAVITLKPNYANFDCGVDKTYCAGANTDSLTCAHAARPIAFNEYFSCTNCFAGVTAALDLHVEIEAFQLTKLKVGILDAHLRGALEFFAGMQKGAAKSGHVSLLNKEWNLKFKAGPIPLDFTVGLPASVSYSAGVNGDMSATVGVDVDVDLGDHALEWTLKDGFKETPTTFNMNVKPIKPSFVAQGGGNADLSMTASLKVDIDKIAWYQVGMVHDLPGTISVDATKLKICADADYDFTATEEADVHFSLFGHHVDVAHLGPKDLYHYRKDFMVHECIHARTPAVVV